MRSEFGRVHQQSARWGVDEAKVWAGESEAWLQCVTILLVGAFFWLLTQQSSPKFHSCATLRPYLKYRALLGPTVKAGQNVNLNAYFYILPGYFYLHAPDTPLWRGDYINGYLNMFITSSFSGYCGIYLPSSFPQIWLLLSEFLLKSLILITVNGICTSHFNIVVRFSWEKYIPLYTPKVKLSLS